MDYNRKISEIENKITTDHSHDKYITIQEFSNLTVEHFNTILAQENLASKNDIAYFVKKTTKKQNQKQILMTIDDKLKNLSKNVNKNELNELSKKVKATSKKDKQKI